MPVAPKVASASVSDQTTVVMRAGVVTPGGSTGSQSAGRVSASALLQSRPVATTPLFGLHRQSSGGSGEPVLLMSIPKRLLRRAVDRNTVRRIAREALRGMRIGAAGSALMLKLRRVPIGFDTLTQRSRKALWRVELDRVFAIGVGRS